MALFKKKDTTSAVQQPMDIDEVMKKFDIKKIGIILAIVLVVVLGIFLIGKAIKSNSVDKESLTKYENYTINYS